MKKHSLQSLQSGVVTALLFCAVSITACVYKLDIQQGNILDREKVAQLKLGMNKRQVRFILGTPLVIDTFNQDRWDYYYSIKDYSPENREGTFHQERLTLLFEKDALSKIDNQLSTEIDKPLADPDQEKRIIPESSDSNQQ